MAAGGDDEGGDGDEAGEDSEGDAVFDLLEVLDALSAHYHEHHDTLLTWPWTLFCAKWARMLDQVSKREAERMAREEARRDEETQRALMEMHQARIG